MRDTLTVPNNVSEVKRCGIKDCSFGMCESTQNTRRPCFFKSPSVSGCEGLLGKQLVRSRKLAIISRSVTNTGRGLWSLMLLRNLHTSQWWGNMEYNHLLRNLNCSIIDHVIFFTKWYKCSVSCGGSNTSLLLLGGFFPPFCFLYSWLEISEWNLFRLSVHRQQSLDQNNVSAVQCILSLALVSLSPTSNETVVITISSPVWLLKYLCVCLRVWVKPLTLFNTNP